MASTSCSDALRKWEIKTKIPVAEAKDVTLCFTDPPIVKMDNTLALLKNCEKLALSSNKIKKIEGVSSLKKLKILSLGRNQIDSISGIEALGNTLQELWLPHNLISELKGIQVMKKMTVFYVSHNRIKDWNEVAYLKECPALEDLGFIGNPIVENMEEDDVRKEVSKHLPNLKKVDGEYVHGKTT